MNLLKQLSEDASAYKAFLNTIVEKIEKFEEEIAAEKRLGLTFEAGEYAPNPEDTVQFKAPTEPVEKPVQHPTPNNRQLTRTHVIYDPSKGKVVDAIKTDPRSRPPVEFAEANAQQIADALKHIQSFSPEVAQKLKAGQISVWVPRAQSAPGQSPNLSAHSAPNTGGTTVVQMSPERLAAARSAANKMSVA